MSARLSKSLHEAEGVIDRLYEQVEFEKTKLAQRLHDDLGGLMVSAVMDLTDAAAQARASDPLMTLPLQRAKATLEAAIDANRKIVEDLRPSILDNFGLFAALKWHLSRACLGAGIECTDSYPEIEPALRPSTSTALFRVAQQALSMTLKRRSLHSTSLHVRVEGTMLSLQFVDDGTPEEEEANIAEVASMRQRLRCIGGQVEIVKSGQGGTMLTAHVPLSISGRHP